MSGWKAVYRYMEIMQFNWLGNKLSISMEFLIAVHPRLLKICNTLNFRFRNVCALWWHLLIINMAELGTSAHFLISFIKRGWHQGMMVWLQRHTCNTTYFLLTQNVLYILSSIFILLLFIFLIFLSLKKLGPLQPCHRGPMYAHKSARRNVLHWPFLFSTFKNE